MARRNRETLKNYFKKGQLPSEEHFSDLIDSMHNIIDEGFSKTVDDGLKLATIGEFTKLISLYKNIDDTIPEWVVKFDGQSQDLLVASSSADTVVRIAQDGTVRVNKTIEAQTINIAGTQSCADRIGSYAQGAVPADRAWHTIVSNLSGCNAFEVIAAMRGSSNGRGAGIATFFATNAHHKRKKIKMVQACMGFLFNRICMRWVGYSGNYSLQIRSRRNYGDGHELCYHVTRLWNTNCFDSHADEE